MTRSVVGVAVLALAFAACGGGGPGSTPEDSFNAVKKAFASEDWNAVVEFVPPSKIAAAEAEFEKQKNDPGAAMFFEMLGLDPEEVKTMDFRQFTAVMIEAMMAKDPDSMKGVLDSEIVSSKITGNKAVLTVKTGDEEDEVVFIEEGGKWYMADLGR